MWGFVWLAGLVGFCVWRWVEWLDRRDEEWLASVGVVGEEELEDWDAWTREMAGSDGWHDVGGDV